MTPDAVRAVAQLALKRRTGARGLRAIMERILLESRYEVPGSDICEVRITDSVVDGDAPPEFIRQPKGPADGAKLSEMGEEEEAKEVGSSSGGLC